MLPEEGKTSSTIKNVMQLLTNSVKKYLASLLHQVFPNSVLYTVLISIATF